MLNWASFWRQLCRNFHTDLATLPQLQYEDGSPLETSWAIGLRWPKLTPVSLISMVAHKTDKYKDLVRAAAAAKIWG